MSIKYRDNNIYSIYAGNKPVHKIILNNEVIWLEDKGRLSDWVYSTIDDKKVLFEYIGTDRRNIIVPMDGGETVINNYASITSNSPFHNNTEIVRVNLQNVPFVNNNMYMAFGNCRNLAFVEGINSNITDMYGAFFYCSEFNQSVQIPSSVIDMCSTFAGCYKLNSDIQIPSSVKEMAGTFSDCWSLNRDIQIPSSVRNVTGTFYACKSFSSNVTIYSNQIINARYCFDRTYSQPKNVHIPFTYTNGESSATFRSFVIAGYLYDNGVSTGQSNVSVIDLNSLND